MILQVYYARIGSSAEFSNQTGRGKWNELDETEMLDPLIDMFHIPSTRRLEFLNYVDDLIRQEFGYLINRLKHSGIIDNTKIAGQFDLMWLNETNERGFPIPVLIEASVVEEEHLENLKISPVIGFTGEVDINSEISKIKKGGKIHLQFPDKEEEYTEVTGIIERLPGPWETTLVRLTNGQSFNINDINEILVDGGKGGHFQAGKTWYPWKAREFLEGIDLSLPVTVIDRNTVSIFRNERGEVLETPTTENDNKIKYKTADSKEKIISINELQTRKAKVFLVDSAMLNLNVKDNAPGGIDFNSNNMDLKEQGGVDFKFSFKNFYDIQPVSINGVLPIITNISTVADFSSLLKPAAASSI